MNMDKRIQYMDLVKKSQEHYPEPREDKASFLVRLDKSFGDCNEINLYTYWQGGGYAEETPEIKYLLVGQDWGNPMTAPMSFQTRLKEIIRDKKSQYIVDEHNIDTGFPTDKHLIILFRQLGYDIVKEQHRELFFTNFCLGYRSGKNTGNMKDVLIAEEDVNSFRELCRILQPENILCLSQVTFQCVCKALIEKWEIRYKGYMKYIETHPKINANADYGGGRIFPLAHCGVYGTLNRSLELQKADWAWVKKETAR